MLNETKEKQSNVRTIITTINKNAFHYHNGIVIVKVITGNIKVNLITEENYLEQDDFIIFNRYELHQIESVNKDNIVAITYIDEDFCKSVISEFELMIFVCKSSKYEDLCREKYKILRKYIDRLINSSKDNEHIIENNAKDLLMYISLNFDFVTCGINFKKFSKKICDRNRKLYKSVMLLDGEYKKASLKEIANLIGVNYSYLRQDVVNRYGYGYKHLKHFIMIEKAAKMILSTNDPITYIGEYCGFSDPKYMIQYFKKYYKCTPSEFRSIYKDSYLGECQIEELSTSSKLIS